MSKKKYNVIPAIIVHGGAKTISKDKAKANTTGCLAAVEATLRSRLRMRDV